MMVLIKEELEGNNTGLWEQVLIWLHGSTNTQRG